MDAEAVKEAFSFLEHHGIIKKSVAHDVWGTTERGRAHVKLLCTIPFPRAAFVDQQGNEIAI
ncbi:hypothetical protein RD110_10810 [Rhodoferax koreense]|uniref:SWIRM domain-containing protein n=2 Tax=Rhodoferax koreensis TaxID=1842727 RepID=A0A1P8JV42_9BURK|nr:hypothetical protein RD110_10810 [Rhodoferax koreense]